LKSNCTVLFILHCIADVNNTLDSVCRQIMQTGQSFSGPDHRADVRTLQCDCYQCARECILLLATYRTDLVMPVIQSSLFPGGSVVSS